MEGGKECSDHLSDSKASVASEYRVPLGIEGWHKLTGWCKKQRLGLPQGPSESPEERRQAPAKGS